MPSDRASTCSAGASIERAYESLMGFLDRLACVGKSQTMDSMAATDLTFSQLRVLFALGAHGDGAECMSVNEIAQQVNLSLAAAGRTVDKLVGVGLVDRREDATDRRVKRVSLTDEGTRVVDSQLSIKQDIIRGFVAGLPDSLRTNLCRALDPIVDNDVDYFSGIAGSEQTVTATTTPSPSTSPKQKVGS